MRISSLIFAFFILSINANSQTVYGIITNEKDEVLADVNVYIEGSLTGTISNDKGEYELNIKSN
jgi:hypothetical protein